MAALALAKFVTMFRQQFYFAVMCFEC